MHCILGAALLLTTLDLDYSSLLLTPREGRITFMTRIINLILADPLFADQDIMMVYSSFFSHAITRGKGVAAADLPRPRVST